eukprot:CAMPEP_0196663386 /NCGR_PEP_ID=MMETSP1086-20130531/52669_1 /TAXON_ID=77921 /ORGANISM="Cyanoptyche  gloeocystis , Strain SAG4.97" /LENGTH=251 /DNA_ID=CAMNT_0041999179 /DNA_START=66 /DNA_END=821 /DNA_ORIENTATION=+
MWQSRISKFQALLYETTASIQSFKTQPAWRIDQNGLAPTVHGRQNPVDGIAGIKSDSTESTKYFKAQNIEELDVQNFQVPTGMVSGSRKTFGEGSPMMPQDLSENGRKKFRKIDRDSQLLPHSLEVSFSSQDGFEKNPAIEEVWFVDSSFRRRICFKVGPESEAINWSTSCRCPDVLETEKDMRPLSSILDGYDDDCQTTPDQDESSSEKVRKSCETAMRRIYSQKHLFANPVARLQAFQQTRASWLRDQC